MIDFDAILRKDKEVKRRREAYHLLEARATDTSSKITGMPTGDGDGKRMERDVVNMVDAKAAWEKSERELKHLRGELAVCLPRLDKWQHQDAIRKRYIEGKKLETVALEMGYDYRHACRLLREAEGIIRAKMS